MLVLLVLAGSSCKKKEGCTDPQSTSYDPEAKVDDGSCTYPPSTFSIEVTHKVGTQPFAFNTTYQDANGRNYQFRTARFHLSSPYLKASPGNTPLNTYLQITASKSSYELVDVAAGDYQGLAFDVGVDSVANHGDPTLWPEDHPLSLMNSNQDHWSWNVGYVFLKIEGFVDTTAAMNGPIDKFFFLHIATDDLLSPVTVSKNFTVPNGEDYVFSFVIDWEKALANVDLRRQTTQTSDNFPLAEQIMHDFVTGITAQ